MTVAMQWSKLRIRAKSFIVLSLRRRVDFHVTSYRQSHDEAEKAWVTLDGKRIFTASWYRHQYAGTEPEELEQHRPQQFGDALRSYLDPPVADALTSKDPFIKAMAMIDRRVGRERLQKHKPKKGDHSLIRLFYDLRIQSTDSQCVAPRG